MVWSWSRRTGRWRAAVYWSLIAALTLALLPGVAVADEEPGDTVPDFSDVPADHPFADEVDWLASSGITAGRTDGSFGVGDPVTRGAMAAFLYRFDGEPDGPFDAPEFDDVPEGSTFETEVAWLASTGITVGRGDGSFGVGDAVTRGAMAAFLYRYEGEPDGPFDALEFDDVPEGSTFETEVAWLASTGITVGRGDGSFGVGDPVTRGAMAAFLFRYDTYQNVGPPGAPDPEPEPAPDPDPDDGIITQLIVRFEDVGGSGFSDAEGIMQVCGVDATDCVARSSGQPDADGTLELDLLSFEDEGPGVASVQWFAIIEGELCSGSTERFDWPPAPLVELTAEISAEGANFCREP